MSHLTSGSMKLEMHGMKSEIADLRAQLAASQERITALEYLLSDIKAFAFNVNPNREQPKDTLEEECEELRVSIKNIWKEFTASQERERILREVVVEVKETSASALQTTYQTRLNKYFLHFIQLTADVLEKAEEVKE